MRSILLNNTVLRQAEAVLEQQLTPGNREAYLRIVVAGQKVAMNGGDNSPFAKLVRTTKDPIRDCVNGAISLCLHMRAESKGVMPMKAMIPASMTLMLQALDLVDKTGLVQVGKPELAQATRMFMSAILNRFGITPDKLRNASQKIHALTQDPASLDKLNIAAGLKPAPGAQVANPGGAGSAVSA